MTENPKTGSGHPGHYKTSFWVWLCHGLDQIRKTGNRTKFIREFFSRKRTNFNYKFNRQQKFTTKIALITAFLEFYGENDTLRRKWYFTEKMTAKKVAVKMSKKINFCDIKNIFSIFSDTYVWNKEKIKNGEHI